MNDTLNSANPSLALQAKRLRWLLLLATILYFVGIMTPMITLSTFIIIEHSFSVLSGVIELLRNGRVFLFVVVTGFSIILPIMKIHVLYKLLAPEARTTMETKRYLHLMHDYGRWAMLDVMIVAVLIVTVKLGAVASIEVHFGLYVFGAAVFLIMLITHQIVGLTSASSARDSV